MRRPTARPPVRPSHAGAAALLAAAVGGALVVAPAAHAAPADVVLVETSAQQVDTPLTNGTSPLDAVFGDLDGDGHLDLVNVRYANGIGIQYGRGDGTFDPLVVRPFASQGTKVAVGDLDADGYDDVVTAGIGGTPSVAVYRGGSARDLAAPTLTPVALVGSPFGMQRPQSVAVGDLDGDGHEDVVVGNGSGSYTVLVGDGTGALTPSGVSFTGSTNSSATVQAVDLDGDGRLDLFASMRSGLTVWRSTSTGPGSFGFTAGVTRSIDGRGFEAWTYDLADLDGDGELDLVLASVWSLAANPVAGVFVVPGNGDGTFAAAATQIAAGNHSGAAVADLDGDGLADVASVNADTAALTVYVANGDGTYTPAPSTNPVGDTHQVLTADVDDDGAPDLQATSYRDYVSHVLTSTAVFTAPTVTEQPQDATVAAGEVATLTAAATGHPAPAVRWERSTDGGTSWAAVADATSLTYSTPPLDPADAGYGYRAVFTNGAGTVTSEVAVVDLAAAPVVTTAPQPRTVVAGEEVRFTAAASDADTVRWQLSTDGGVTFADLPGETGSELVVVASEELDGAVYRAAFTGPGGQTYSAGAVLSVDAAPVGTTPSVPRDVVATQTGPRQITITWTAPADPGSSPITAYDAGYATPRWGNGGPVPADTLRAVFDDVEPGEYTASVAAVNDEGSGPRVFVPVTVRTQPSAPAQGAGPAAPGGTGAPAPTAAVVDRGDRATDRSVRPGRDDDELATTGTEVVDGLLLGASSLGLGLLLTGFARRRGAGVRTT